MAGMAHILPESETGYFPSPCPVCGVTDGHAAWRATVTGSPATFCPHPGERGHGTGCCCAGLSARRWSYRMATPPPLCPHGTPYAQPCYSCGWTCPACGRCYAPWVRECNYRHEAPEAASPFPLNIGPIPPEPVTVRGAVIDVPPEMAIPHCVKRMQFGTVWTDVMPGLQAMARELNSKDGYVRVDFRLTPEGGTDEPPVA